ncbi:DUF4232 domain-containing protein [Streptomyces sp. NPDC002523]
MQYGTNTRVTVAAAAVIASALALTACQSGDGAKAADKHPATPTTASSPAASSAATAPPAASGTTAPPVSGGGKPAPGGAPASPASAPSAATVPACAATALEVSAYQAADRPVGTGTGAAVIEFKNVSAKPCALRGHPTVAGAGNGSPEHSTPLTVTRTGSASTVRVAPGGKAWVKLTFVQVQGEGDGYCASGAKPAVYPTLVIGPSGSGKHQVALDDGRFAECDNKVTATAVSASKPA